MNKLELLNKLRTTEETALIDLLGLTSDDIVDAFLDRIEEQEEYLQDQLEDRELHGYQEDEGI
jgi:hypothetical protein